VESRLRARITALAEAEPALADDLALRGALIEIVDLAEIGSFELRLPADTARARLTAGVPLIDRLDLPIASSVATLFERLTVAFLADDGTRQPAEALLLAVRGHRLHAEQLVGEAVVGHHDHLTALAESADVSTRLVVMVADLAARALLAAVARRLGPALSLGTWDRGYCPICGGLPLLAEVGGALRCGRCASSWAHPLRLCPDCTTGAFNVIEIEDDVDLGGWQIAACDACPEYLKIAPSPRSDALADLLVDDLETWHLDRWALQEGLQRRGGVGYRLEHGEPAGEELDDD